MKITDKLYDEFEAFKKGLLKMTTEQVIDKAYELVVKENIPYIFEDIDLEDGTYKFFNSMDNLLDYLYDEWLRCDYSMVSDLTCCFEDLISELEYVR